ncbi:lysophospholipid acyltransferase family protein [Aestuariibius sp. HNIBRBA575]|uniref:lysophospholipid acyltransferase family protein n=1 Tax=Aestuariibius sp. HNIBRBA575 TaxID=3233343 RepID=UPI0034A2AF92
MTHPPKKSKPADPSLSSEQAASVGFSDWLTDRMARSVLGLALALPYRFRPGFVGGFIRLILGPIAGYQKRALSNLSYIFPDMSPAEQRRIAKAAMDNAGRTLIENYSTTDLAAQMAQMQVTGPGLDAIKTAKEQGQGVIFVTGHYGNYEAPRHALHHLGYKVGGLYRPMANVLFNQHYVRTMESVSGPIFEQGRRGTMGFARHIKSGGMAVLLFDLFDWRGKWVDFMGRPSKTALSAAELALKFNAIVVPYFGIRTETGFQIVIEAPIDHSDAQTMTQDMSHRLEQHIRNDPGQWMWFHRRWKEKKPH